MNIKEINDLWIEYKKKYGIDSDIMIEDVKYDTEEYVEGCFNLLELMEGKYILHLNPKVHIYRDSYVKFILFHEFTHFYDFFHCPYEQKNEKLFFMNAYSEFHACKVTLARCIEQYQIKLTDIDKIQIPGPFREISIRKLLNESLSRLKYYMEIYYLTYQIHDFINAFRQMMYLFGYISLFKDDSILVQYTMKVLDLGDDRVLELYKCMKENELDKVVPIYKSIADDVILAYIRISFRRYYDRDILSDEELQEINNDNYEEYIRILNDRIRSRNSVKELVDAQKDEMEEQLEEAAMLAYFMEQLRYLII